MRVADRKGVKMIAKLIDIIGLILALPSAVLAVIELVRLARRR